MPSTIKFDHLANNKVIIITDHEIWGQNLKTETAVLVLGMSGTNISIVFFLVIALGTVFDLVNWVDHVKVPKLEVRYHTNMILHASKVRNAPMVYIKTQLKSCYS